MDIMKIPRILLSAGSSGSGKTLITCGILQALKNRKMKVASFKCGPDYIDPMFHSRVIGTKSRNLDTFFFGPEITRHLLYKNAVDADIAVMEGVMGYYDGVAGTTTQASAYDLAVTTDTPTILIINSKGMSVSLAAYIKGFLQYRENSMINGIILNQMSPMLYPRMKALIEEELHVDVVGYVPRLNDCIIESRHLGLVLPEEIEGLQNTLERLALKLEKSLDFDAILKIAQQAPEVSDPFEDSQVKSRLNPAFSKRLPEEMRIGYAKDAAFCFFYEDNFDLMRQMGAELIPFSPLTDEKLPSNLDGILLYGGYPELHGKELQENASMRKSVHDAVVNGMPCLAECGGFMYLHKEMQGADGVYYQMTDVIDGKVHRTDSLKRFGYITLHEKEDHQLGDVRAHEFHYYESDCCGSDFCAQKPKSNRGWECIHRTEHLLAGYPHVHYYANPEWIWQFFEKCLLYHENKENV